MRASPVFSCANCDRRFVGRWCPRCGQEAMDIRRPFSQLVVEFLGDFLAFDARIWRTAVPLFTRPGVLTREYVAGHRAPYVPPFKLYVFAGFVFFAVLALTDGGPIRFVASGPSGDGIVKFLSDSEAEVSDHWFWGRMERAARDPGRFEAALVQTLGYAHFLIAPLFALLLKIFWRRRYYMEHLVFSAHLHAFELLTGATVIAIYVLAGNPQPASGAADLTADLWWLAVAVYLLLALRRVYADRWRKLAFKFVALGLAYVLLFAAVVGGVAFFSLLFV